MKTKLVTLLSGLCILLLWLSPAWSQPQRSQDTLKGIRGVGLVLNGISAEAERDGLDKSVLTVDIEDRLRNAGIKVHSRAEGVRAPGQPHLLVRVIDQKRSDMELYSISIAVYLVQTVRLSRESKMVCPAETWDLTGVVSVGSKELGSVRQLVLEYVDLFIAALRKANPGVFKPEAQAQDIPTAPMAAEAPRAGDAAPTADQPPAPPEVQDKTRAESPPSTAK